MQHHWRTEKILTLEQAAQKAAELKAAKKKIVTVNGSFDILHAGHLDMLEEAKQQGDILFVGINSDRSVRGYKGEDRPFIPEQERAALLVALICVDYVVILDGAGAGVEDDFIRAVKPRIHANGAEYGEPSTWREWPVMQEVNAKGYSVARRPGLATTDIIDKIRGK
jgi:rfaE bifunctional protein nucleotidyltransferase chain/domain